MFIFSFLFFPVGGEGAKSFDFVVGISYVCISTCMYITYVCMYSTAYVEYEYICIMKLVRSTLRVRK